ncbi:hypothetical protein DRQ18_05990 [bacterium]|nr:MAG: hypothetical protein DRQ18_05990 [bacterium]
MKCRIWFIVLLFIALCLYSKSWTIMVYLDADCDLEVCGIVDINEMELTVDTSLFNVVVQIDRNPEYDSSNGNWETTRRYYILPDTEDIITINSLLLEDIGEANMGDPQTLIDFAVWAARNYPADHYALILWDHGSGWYKKGGETKSVCHDETDNDALYLSQGELRDALSAIKDSLGKNIDLIAFDACLMGMVEVEYEVYPYCDAVVHSEHTEPGAGYPYHEILLWLSTNPDATPQELAEAITELYTNSYLPGGSQCCSMSVTQSSVDFLPTYWDFNFALDRFSRELIKAGGLSNSYILSARDASQKYPCPSETSPEHVDLIDFARKIKGEANLPQTLREAAESLEVIFQNFLIAEGHYSDTSDWNVDSSKGVAIYLPQELTDPMYDSLIFSSQNTWIWFLKGYTNLPLEPFLVYMGTGANDTLSPGYNLFRIWLFNSGGATATDVRAWLFCDDPYASIIDTFSTFPDIGSETWEFSDSMFSVEIDSSVPDGRRMTFYLVSFCNSTYWKVNVFSFWVHNPSSGTKREGHGRASIYTSWIFLDIPRGVSVDIELLDVLGRKVKTWKNVKSPKLSVADLPSGIYFMKILTPERKPDTRKILILH